MCLDRTHGEQFVYQLVVVNWIEEETHSSSLSGNIKIKFYELDSEWSAYGDFGETDVHHQYAIIFKWVLVGHWTF